MDPTSERTAPAPAAPTPAAPTTTTPGPAAAGSGTGEAPQLPLSCTINDEDGGMSVQTWEAEPGVEKQDFVQLSSAGLDANTASDLVTVSTTGATSMFVGTTRDTFEGKVVTRLEYEAYNGMAIKKAFELCVTARSKWSDLTRIAILHRLGEVPVKQPSVIIAVSSPHRRASLEAVHHLIDALKVHVPIWKKEFYADESGAWKENKEALGKHPTTTET